MVNLQLITSREYLTELLTQIPKARRQISMVAMTVAIGDLTLPVYPLLLAACQRGVKVELVFDVYSRLYMADDYTGLRDFRQRRKLTEVWLRKLQEAGATIAFIGKIKVNPYKRRCHVKATVIDDTIFSFGGVNFTNGAFKNTDYMLTDKDQKTADSLVELVHQIGTEPPYEDQSIQLSDTTTVLYDAGVPKKSIIYETACDLAEQAEKILYVSQMAPSGRLAELINAKNNVCYFCRPSQQVFPDGAGLFIDQHRYGTKNNYKGKKYIHAKFMLFEMPDGNKALVSGSNNFSWRGVAFGTKEIAVCSTDAKLWRQLYEFMQQSVV